MHDTVMTSSAGSPGRLESQSSDTDIELQTQAPNSEGPEKRLPEGGYGWVCVVSVFLINGHTWGINSVGTPEYNPYGNNES